MWPNRIFLKFKFTYRRHIENRFIAINQQSTVCFQWNFAWESSFSSEFRQWNRFHKIFLVSINSITFVTFACSKLYFCMRNPFVKTGFGFESETGFSFGMYTWSRQFRSSLFLWIHKINKHGSFDDGSWRILGAKDNKYTSGINESARYLEPLHSTVPTAPNLL